jgi:hypothetical protein
MNELLDCIPAAKQPCTTPIRVICLEHVTTANIMTDYKMGAQFTARSILEWAKKSGIVIANCEYEDHQTVRDCIDYARAIERYVREAQLWPHEENFG